MLLTITTTHPPATDLGYLLHKHPQRAQDFELWFGQAHVFYPQAQPDCCTAALLLDVDPVKLVRRRSRQGGSFALQHYINDRPYVASSFLSVAIAQVYRSALNGRCQERAQLVDTPLPLQAKIAVLPCRDGAELLRRLFEPLGYSVSAQRHTLDEQFPQWGASDYFTVELAGQARLQDLLTHLYVLAPVLDGDKHYWVGEDEVSKLLQRGEGWLADHPERELITTRYLKRLHSLTSSALAQLAEDAPDADEVAARHDQEEASIEASLNLNQQRLEAVLAALVGSEARRVLDLGCGEGKLLQLLLPEQRFTEIVGLDVSHRSLARAAERLRLQGLPERQRQRIKLLHGSLLYRDQRLAGYDAATVIEVLEHLDLARLAALERVLFEFARPGTVILTTPNREYNVKWASLPGGQLRHRDHRFEWTREAFQAWAGRVAAQYGYTARFVPIGPQDPGLGAPTQMGIFERCD